MERSLQKVCGGIKDKIKKIFHPDELSKAAHQTKFIQRSTALLQGKDFVELMTTVSIEEMAKADDIDGSLENYVKEEEEFPLLSLRCIRS
jgi:hypothetical protein